MLAKVISEVRGKPLTLFASSGYTVTTRAPSSWQTLQNAFELSPSIISKKFQTQLLRDWAIALSCVADATDLV